MKTRKPKVKRPDWQARCMEAATDAETAQEMYLEIETERDALTEQLKAKDARIALLEHDRSEMGKFMSDCQLVLATAPCTLCGAKWINAGGLQEAFKRYADRTAIPPKGTK